MANSNLARDTLQGTLDLLVLETLARSPEHGHGIALHILPAGRRRLAKEIESWRKHTAAVAAFLDFA